MSQRTVIIGTGGRLGGALARYYRLQEQPVIGFDRKALDLTRPEIIRDRLEPLYFDAVIISGALTAVDYAEDHVEEAMAANVHGPRLIADICRQKKARLIHISTDYVYEGSQPGLRKEIDPTYSAGVYGHSKLEGEKAVLSATDGQALVVRISWVFGPDRPAFPDSLIATAQKSDTVAAIADKYSTPTYSEDFARDLHPFVYGDFATEGGILNLCNEGSASWQEYGQAALELAAQSGVSLKTTKVAPQLLAEMKAFKAPRPKHTSMCLDKYVQITGRRPRPWPEALADYINRHYGRG